MPRVPDTTVVLCIATRIKLAPESLEVVLNFRRLVEDVAKSEVFHVGFISKLNLPLA